MIRTFDPGFQTTKPDKQPHFCSSRTNDNNYHSHLSKWYITNQKSWYILQHLCQHTYWVQTIFMYMMYSSLVDYYWSFGRMCCLHHCPRGDNTLVWYNGTHLSNHMAYISEWSGLHGHSHEELQISQYFLISFIAENIRLNKTPTWCNKM